MATGTYTLDHAIEEARPQIEEVTNEDSLAEVCRIAAMDLYETQFGETSGAVETEPHMAYYFTVENPGRDEETGRYDPSLKPICTACWAGAMFIARNIVDCRREGNTFSPQFLADDLQVEWDERMMVPARNLLASGDGLKLMDRMLAIEDVRALRIDEAYKHMGRMVSEAGLAKLNAFEAGEQEQLDRFFSACASNRDLDEAKGTLLLPTAHVWKHSRPPYGASGKQMSDAAWVEIGCDWVKERLHPFLKDFENDPANFEKEVVTTYEDLEESDHQHEGEDE